MIHSTTCNLQPWCFGLFLQLLSTAVYFTTSVILNIVDMGSAESQFDDGVLPGDSQRDGHSPQFLTPDILERTWLDLDPSPDLELPWEKGIWGSIFCNKPFCVSPQRKWKRLACPADPQREQLEKPTKMP